MIKAKFQRQGILILDAADRIAAFLEVVSLICARIVGDKEQVPRVIFVAHRRRPEVGVVGKIVETGINAAEAARKSSKATAIGSTCIWGKPMRCASFFHFPTCNAFATQKGCQ